VIKLNPKKATVAASAAERKLMQELEEMKALVKQLKESGGNGGADIAALLAAKQSELANQLEGGDGAKAKQDEALKQQQDDYQKLGIRCAQARGASAKEGVVPGACGAESTPSIPRLTPPRARSLTHFAKDTPQPYFINLDEDPFRSNRFMYVPP
jgi:transcription initiation factor TFIID subunit TAF12